MQLISFFLILALSWNVISQDLLQKELLLSSPRTAFTSVEVDGKIYLAGGLTTTNQVSSTIDVFDIATQTWNSTLSLPSPRFYVTPAVVSPHIYFLGGWEMTFTTAAYQYDAGSDSLQKMPELGIYRPIQISLHGSTLVFLGSNQAKFLQLTKTGDGWITNSDLDNLMMNIAGIVVFSHENLIFMFGGVNVSSRQPLTDAWLFDIDSSNLTRYENAINPIGYIPRGQYSVAVTNNIMTATNNVGDYVLFNINTSTWLNITIMNATNALSVPGFTFIFTSSGYYTVDWSDPRADPTFFNSTGPVVYSLGFADTAAYFVNDQATAVMHCFSDGVWTTSSGAPSISTIITTLEWPSYGTVFATSDGVYLFNNCSLIFTARQQIRSVVVSHPVPDQLYVAVPSTGSNSSLHKYDSTLTYLGSTDVPLVPEVCFDNIVFQFLFRKAFSLTTLSTPSSIFTDTAPFDARTKWAWSGQFFVALSVGSATIGISEQVDIYNYKTNMWLNSTSHPALSQTNGYAQAFNMDGVLAIFANDKLLKFNVTSNSWLEEALNESIALPFANISPMALEINDTVYTMVNALRLRIVSHGAITFDLITDQEIPFQMIYNEWSNQLFITTSRNLIYTWNIDTRQKEIFLLPRFDGTEVLTGSSGAFFVASAYNNLNAIDYCNLLTSQWYSVPGVANYVRPAVMRGLNAKGRDLVVIAGGMDKEFQFFTNSVKILDLSPPAAPVVANETIPSASSVTPGLQDNSYETTLIVAIVVPVGAVLIAGALVAFFLIRRHKKRKSHGTPMSTIGLENQYGQWFIPFSDLTFHEQLGQGASGQVFKGSWKNTSVALKLSMTQANNSVLSELSLMMQLRPHPNVVQLLGFSVHPETDSIVLVLEYCNQGALDELLFDKKSDIPLNQKLEWLIGISKGLSHLHSNNIVHRDVAARNVLLHQNEAKLTDFGMSRIVDDEQQRGTTKSELGPIRWMSPESLKRKEYSTKSDIWSFGIVAFEIVAQQEPHIDKDPIQVGQEIRDSGLTPHLPDTCPNDLASVIMSCWHMEPSQRPSFEQITSQLEDVAKRI